MSLKQFPISRRKHLNLASTCWHHIMQILCKLRDTRERERERGGRLRSTDVSFFLYHNVEEAKTRTKREIRKCGSPGCNCRCELCQDGVWNWADASERASSIQRMDVVIELIGLHLKFQNTNYRIWRLKWCCIRRRVMTSQGGRGDDCPFVDVTAGGRDVTMVIHFQLN